MTREPDRYEEKAAEVLRDVMDAERRGDNMDPIIAAALAAAESSALERAADIADSYGCDYAARSIRALASPAAAPAAGTTRCQCNIGAVAASCVYATPDRPCECACHALPSEPAAPAHLQSTEIGCAEARIAELEYALRMTREHALNAGCRGYLGSNFFDRIDAALAARAATASTPSDGSAET